MVSLKSTLIAVAVAVAVQADYSIDPNSVPLSTRKNWCTSQTAQCPLICLDFAPGSGKPITNTCDPAVLTYGCVCGNGLRPNISEYSLTLPFYTCQQFQNNCVAGCGIGANACASACRDNNPCGAQNPKQVNTTSTTTGTATGTAATSSSSSTSESGSGSSSEGSGGSAAPRSTSVQASLTMAAAITGLLVGPFLLFV